MANQLVRNSATGTMGNAAAKRSRFEKAEVAFGTIPAAAYASADTLVFDQIPSKQIIYGFIVTGEGHKFEFFNGTDYSTALAFTYNSGTGTTVLPLYYYVEYIRGTGGVHPGLANGPTESTGDKGVLLQVTITIT